MNQPPNKIQIPKKTKIAIHIMRIYAGIILAFFALVFLTVGIRLLNLERLLGLLMVIVYFIFTRFLSKGNSLIWGIMVTWLTLMVLGSLADLIFTRDTTLLITGWFSFIFNIIPWLLLLLDRKNYFAAVEKTDKDSKTTGDVVR
jgi:hypothetical protein